MLLPPGDASSMHTLNPAGTVGALLETGRQLVAVEVHVQVMSHPRGGHRGTMVAMVVPVPLMPAASIAGRP
jgi:hypothetical protein